MKVKICGITDVETALSAVKSGADAVGFVFAESKRKITLEEAKEITRSLPDQIYKVGVFVNELREKIEEISSFVGLTHIQLHGDESAQFSESLSLPVIKAWGINEQSSWKEILEYPCEYILLDGPKGKYQGGNGKSFDWSHFHKNEFDRRKIILAGGLTIENLEDGIKAIRPTMIDVSSGVETNGKKDVNKIQLFIEKAKGILDEERVV
jgi:phosphoribosylanthranilate isomerase